MLRIAKTLKRDLLRSLIILSGSLAAGTGYNTLHPAGIPPSLLTLPLSDVSREQAWRPVSTDSAFFRYVEGSASFLDIRPASAFAIDHIPGAVSLPFARLVRSVPDPEPERQRLCIVYAFDPQSETAVTAVRVLIRAGFTNIGFLRNGLAGWIEYGFPVTGSRE